MKAPSSSSHGTDILSVLRGRLLRITTGLILVWFVAVWWGERGIFSHAVGSCSWERWETWTTQAQPHHVLLIADPQLVDPHTYPGRPWPLNSLTILYTDLYLRRTYRNLQQTLIPDSTLFLGDLFDGGREWGTAQYKSPEDRYKSYGQSFWRKEYVRFSNLFLRDWFHGPVASRSAPYGRKLLASVPGNHDLGFASGINPAVKGRFDAYFGPLNRVDVLGNHSFVSLDTVSLSAMDQVDPNTGAHGGDAGASATATSHLWRPVEDFLGDAKVLRHRAVQHEWQQLSDTAASRLSDPTLVTLTDDSSAHASRQAIEVPSSQFPTLILSHVPLFRPGDTPCGPHREGRPSISLSAGYQYQNVLTPLVSSDIIKHLSPEEIVQIYSGDDHDYCEISHSEYTGAIKEITVKSMSWAMGIRKPAVQLVSLWNPINLERLAQNALNSPGQALPTPKDTVQNQLCLLPDQLLIFIRYAQLLLLTILILAISAFRLSSHTTRSVDYDKSEPLLPLNETHKASSITHVRSRSSSVNHQNASLSARNSYGNIPASSLSASPSKRQESGNARRDNDPFAPPPHVVMASVEADDWGMPQRKSKMNKNVKWRIRRYIFVRSLCEVALPVLAWYGILMWLDWG